MLRTVFALCLCGGMTGCASVFPALPIAGKPTPADEFTDLKFEFAVPPQISFKEIAALSPGSQVTLFDANENSRVTGEVLQASPTGVALKNVTRYGEMTQGSPTLRKVPYVSRLYKNTAQQERLPVYWVPIDRITTAQLLAPPPEGYVAPQLAIDTTSGVAFERIGIDFDFNVEEEPAAAETFVLPHISQRHQTVQ